MLYILLRGCWCDVVLNGHVPTEDKIDDVKDSISEELKRIFDKKKKSNAMLVTGHGGL
jgi:hypothetical protein